MSLFVDSNKEDEYSNVTNKKKAWIARELVSQKESINLWNPRGGSTITLVKENIVIFGGADRNQTHFNDLIICRQPKNLGQPVWEKVEATGDVPTPRSGHAVAAHGRYMFLYGGIDFAEEVVYNDLYTLNIETLEWKYVGESGAEIPKRNSHSLMIVSQGEMLGNDVEIDFYLVVYGGASPDEGVFADCYFAVLPSMDKIDSDGFYVEWITFENDGPGSREMHSCCNRDGAALIIGGRNEDGSLRSDVWVLRVTTEADKTLVWEKLADLELHLGRCAHGAAIIENNLCIFGGFTSDGIAGDLIVASLSIQPEISGNLNIRQWDTFDNLLIDGSGRFGMCICTAPLWLEKEAAGFCLFGGVSAENDFGDVWHLCRID